MHWSHRSLSTPIIAAAMAALAAPAWAAMEANQSSAPAYAPVTQVVIAQNTVTVIPGGSQVVIAPTAPPPAQVEVIPAPPATATQVLVWQPGHWSWNGAVWSWIPGQYTARPQAGSVWVPGQWIQQDNGEYAWIPGHWS
jgi:hypothetical protein